jgi:hypothetical protein
LQQRPVQPYRKNKSHPHDRVLNLLQHLGNYLRLRRTPVKQFRALTQSHSNPDPGANVPMLDETNWFRSAKGTMTWGPSNLLSRRLKGTFSQPSRAIARSGFSETFPA